MLKAILSIVCILFTLTVFAQRPVGKSSLNTSGKASAPSSPTWATGKIDLVESFNDKIQIRWQGVKTQDCAKSDDVVITLESAGSQAALDRAFKIAMTAAVSDKPIRVLLDGCVGNLQKATVIQFCVHEDCAH